MNVTETLEPSRFDVNHVIAQILPELDILPLENPVWRVEKPRVKIRTGSLFKLENLNDGQLFALKTYQSTKKAEIQYQLLQESLQRMGQDTYTVPRPWAVAEKRPALLFEWLSGKTLDTLLWLNTFQSSKRLVLIDAAGRWLRAFHDAWGRQLQPLDLQAESSRIDRTLIKHSDIETTLLRDSLYIKARKVMQRFATSAPETILIPASVPHGDFTPTNIMMSKSRDKVYGIDLTASRNVMLPVTRDITRFLTYLAVRRMTVAKFDMGTSYSKEAKEFLDAYDPNMQVQQELFIFLHLCEVLRRWASRLGMAFQAGGRNLWRDCEIRRLRVLATHLTVELDRCA